MITKVVKEPIVAFRSAKGARFSQERKPNLRPYLNTPRLPLGERGLGVRGSEFSDSLCETGQFISDNAVGA